MVMDILTAAIVIISAFWYARKGFAMSVMTSLQWLVGITVALMFCDDMADFIAKKTSTGLSLNLFFQQKVQNGLEESPAIQQIPEVFHGWVQGATDYIADVTADSLTTIVLTVLSFIAMILAVKIIAWLFCRIFSREHHKGIIGLIDSALGLAIGTFLGAFYVMLLMALLTAVMGFLPENISGAILNSLQHSYFAGDLYEGNILFTLLRNLFL